MTTKLSVKEYASRFKISAQAVYQKLNKGTLKFVKVDGVKYVLVDAGTGSLGVKAVEQDVEQPLVQILNKQIEKLNKQIRKKDKEIERLNKELLNSVKAEKDTLLKYISELKQLQLITKPKEEDPIDAELEPTAKSKKKKKSKNKKKRKK